MNRIFLIITILIHSICHASTSIPAGNVSGTWTVAGSPYLIQGSIMIPNGSTLSIEPGVTVSFQGSYKFYIQGRLLAIGTSTDSISFIASNTTIGWLGIRFDKTPSTNDTSKFNYCKIKYGQLSRTDSDGNGAALYFSNFSKAIISHCNISNNFALNGKGGGIYLENSNPEITNNSISNNSSHWEGGGICCDNSSSKIFGNSIFNNTASHGAGILCYKYGKPIISNNLIYNNIAIVDGGGICTSDGCEPLILNNTISFNTANTSGGICVASSNPQIENNFIKNNIAKDNGGGILYVNSNPIIIKNVIAYNSASYGGGLHGTYGAPPISNNFISNNTSIYNGGGIYLIDSAPTVSNNVISNNVANGGAGIYFNTNDHNFYSSNPNIINCTIVNNSAANGGAIYCNLEADPTLTNTILWGNTSGISGMQVYLNNESNDPDFYYCDIQGGSDNFGLNGNFFTGNYQNNIDALPLFVSPTSGNDTTYNGFLADWSLQNESPCINMGNPIGSYPSKDLASNPRINDGLIDIGTYEYQVITNISSNNILSSLLIYPNPTTNTIIIELNQQSEIELLTIEGQILKKIKSNDNFTLVDISELPNRAYIVKIKTDKGITTSKIIKY